MYVWVGCVLGWDCVCRNVVTDQVTVWLGWVLFYVVLLGRGGSLWFGFGDIRGRRAVDRTSYSGCNLVVCISPLFIWTLGVHILSTPNWLDRIHMGGLGFFYVLGKNTSPGDIRQDWEGVKSFGSSFNLHPAPFPESSVLSQLVSYSQLMFSNFFGLLDTKGWDRYYWWQICLL
ncbi:hypothetical protein Hanom_Chr07g00660751 [Helianthus anomalus]